MQPAKSNYKQIHATITEESNRRFTIRLKVKPVHKQWDQAETIYHDTFKMSDPPGTMAGVLTLLGLAVLAEGERRENS